MSEAPELTFARLAFGNALAMGESEPADKRGAGYNILYGGDRFSSFDAFPDWPGIRVNGRMTHAAGRYQFQPATWAGVRRAVRLPDFAPSSQDAAMWFLARQVYRHQTGRSLATDLLASQFTLIPDALRSTWTSVGPKTIKRLQAEFARS